MVRAGFFRNRGAYLVGRLVLKGTELKPLVIALLNSEEGVRAEAVLHAVPHVHNLCSSTEAPFQVTNRHYHELAAFLKSIMPGRPLGLHYSTIGYYHFSKVAVVTEVRSEEHTSELQSQSNLVCRLLLEKKKNSTASTREC